MESKYSFPSTVPQIVNNERCLNDFRSFFRLPSELRLKIWAHFLEDATPHMYRFELRYPKRRSDEFWRRWPLAFHSSDQVILQPTTKFQNGTKDLDLPAKLGLWFLKQSTNTRRIASATCAQSRQVVLELFPDTLKFRILPKTWGRFDSMHLRGSDDLTEFPEHILRFSGLKDIFIFNATCSDQEAAIRMAQGKIDDSGELVLPEAFLRIRRVGIAVDDFTTGYAAQWYHPRNTYGARMCNDNCTTEQCRDCCRFDPLPAFTRLFPLIEKLYIAGVPETSTHQLGDVIEAGKIPSTDTNCPCPDRRPQHSWSLIRSSDACGWFAIYDEQSSCAFPTLKRVEELRSLYRAHFPYYRALSHLEIRFIQPLRRDCEHCIYTD